MIFVPSSIPHPVFAASIGIPDTMLLMLLALMIFGPRRLPEIGRQIGKLMYEFRKISNDFKFQMEEELRISEEVERQRQLSASTAEIPHMPPPVPVFAAAAMPTDASLTDAIPTDAIPTDGIPEPTLAETSSSPDSSSPDSSSPDSSGPDSSGPEAKSPAQKEALESASTPERPVSFPTIQPPTQGGVVPRAFRGLVPTADPASASALAESAIPESIPTSIPEPGTSQQPEVSHLPEPTSAQPQEQNG